MYVCIYKRNNVYGQRAGPLYEEAKFKKLSLHYPGITTVSKFQWISCCTLKLFMLTRSPISGGTFKIQGKIN